SFETQSKVILPSRLIVDRLIPACLPANILFKYEIANTVHGQRQRLWRHKKGPDEMDGRRAIKMPLPAGGMAAGLATGAWPLTDLIFGRIRGWGWPLPMGRSDV
ncbi:MAG TPA: hypothetical protein VGF97_11765, partial [Rhizomicrobium sp.]